MVDDRDNPPGFNTYYHGTNSKYLDDIRKHGLTSDDTRNVNVSEDKAFADKYARLTKTQHRSIDPKNHKPVTLEIHTDVPLKANYKWGSAYYTDKGIPPEHIVAVHQGKKKFAFK